MRDLVNIFDINSFTAYEFERVCRSYTQYVYLENNIALCRILSKYKIYVDTRDISVTPHLIMDGFWETWLTQCLAKIIKPGDVCIDIGANLGYYSILMSALAGSAGQTIAVEPNPAMCKLLRLTAGINHPGFQVAQVALSNKRGKIVLRIPATLFGGASIIPLPAGMKGLKISKARVEMITLDQLLERMGVPHVNVIKMDVEGAEALVFEGMKKTIENNPGLKIIMEYNPFFYENARQFTEYLFNQFMVYQIKDVADMTRLEESAIEKLLQLDDHTDIFLERK